MIKDRFESVLKDKLEGAIKDRVESTLFYTQEKLLKKIEQDREKGDAAGARKRALAGLEKWPEDFDLACIAITLSLELSDHAQIATLLRNAYRRHGGRRAEILDLAREAFRQSSNTAVGSFLVETLLKARNLEAVQEVLQRSPETFLADLAKRAETKARNLAAEGEGGTAVSTENDLLLGLLRIEMKRYDSAVAALGAALDRYPEDAKFIGSLLVRIEQEMPSSAAVKYYLGRVSAHLAHPEKMEVRFFQCLELPSPPIDGILATLEGTTDKPPNHALLAGEAHLRAGRASEGASLVRKYLAEENPAAGSEAPGAERVYLGKAERYAYAEKRLAGFPEESFAAPEVAFLFCDVAAELGHAKQATDVLRALHANGDNAAGIIAWIEGHEETSLTAPAQLLLARLRIETGAFELAARAAAHAADMDSSTLAPLIELVRRAVEGNPEAHPLLRRLLAELLARAGDRPGAEEIFARLQSERALPDADLIALSGSIMGHCGVFIDGVLSAVEMGVRSGQIEVALPHVLSFCREKPDDHGDLAAGLRKLADAVDGGWNAVAGILDAVAKEGDLSPQLRFLQAACHLFTGAIERSVFAFDSILMENRDRRYDVIELYKAAVDRGVDNPTLHLALYQLNLEEEEYGDAARHLCRMLALDPGQIRDIMPRFEKLVEKDPANLGIWEEMLKTALAIKHTSLAREVLKRAVAVLPQEKSAALHLYGAKVSAADGKLDDSIKCIAMSLTSPDADLPSIEEELRAILARDAANAEAHFLLGDALLQLGSEEEAISAWSRCIELDASRRAAVTAKLDAAMPLAARPWLLAGLRGELAWAAGERDEALRLFAVAQAAPEGSLARLGAGLEQLHRQYPDDLKLGVALARNRVLEGRYAEAVALLEELLGRDASLAQSVIDILIVLLGREPKQFEANRLFARLMIAGGEPSRGLDSAISMMNAPGAEAAAVERAATELLPAFDENALFLVHYASAAARAGAHADALARYRRAFEIDASKGELVLAEMALFPWPEALSDAARLIETDCLIAGGNADEAFAILSGMKAGDAAAVEEVVRRIEALITRRPTREHFSFGARLLAGSRERERAERFLARGAEILGCDEGASLTIELAELLHSSGETERAGVLFRDAVAHAGDRAGMLRRIEAIASAWADREIEALRSRLAAGALDPSDAERLVELAIDRNRAGEALEAISAGPLAGSARSVALARLYLALERPSIALAILIQGSSGAAGAQARSLEGLACETLGLYGRAAAAFAAAVASGGGERWRERAETNYAMFIAAQSEETALVIDKTDCI